MDGKTIREPTGPREIPCVGNYLEIYPDHLGNHERLFHRYGSVIKTVVMGRTIYLTNDPRVSEVIFGENEFFTKKTSETNHPLFWISDVAALFTADSAADSVKLAHKFIPPSMSPKAVQHYMPTMQQEIQSSFNVFDAFHDRNQSWNAYQYMLKLSSQVVSKVVLGLDVGHFHAPDTQLHELVSLVGELILLVRQASLSFTWLKYVPFSPAYRISALKKRISSLVHQAVNVWPHPGASNLPIPQAALQSTCIADYLKRAVDDGNQKLPDEYVDSNTLVVLAAGISTTSSMLSYFLYFLVNYPETQTKVLQELINHNVTPEKCWTYDDIMSLPYLDSFVKEGLRLHGPAFQPARTAKTDVIVPGAYRIPAGAVVNPLFSSIHRNKEYWENPSLFYPERWLSANPKKHRMAYTPFAAGPRGCVGFNVAHVELRMILAMLVLRYEFIDMSRDPVVYDHEYLLERLVNRYVRAKKRTTWPEEVV